MGQNSGNNTMTGSDNTGLGLNTLIGDTTGSDNTAIGFTALINNKTGFDNTVMGSGAMESNTNGSYNISIGFNAMYNSLSSAGNIAIGNSSLNNTSGNNNTAIGDNSMTACTTGSYNLGDGFESFPNLLTGQYNIAFGTGAGVNITNGNYNIDISASGTLDETGIIRIGTTGKQTATYLTGIVYGNGSGITNIPLTGLTNGYFQGVCGATNGFASWSTNQLAPGYAAGWTNLGTVGGITNRMYANVIGTSGSIVYWGRTGANGVTPCGFPIFTNTVSVVGQVIPVGVNCGIQINSGVGVTITPYSQGE
jgi:hypothetical protein